MAYYFIFELFTLVALYKSSSVIFLHYERNKKNNPVEINKIASKVSIIPENPQQNIKNPINKLKAPFPCPVRIK